MKSVQWHEFRKTFRYRLAIFYGLTVSAALLVTFVIALLLARRTAVGFVRAEMNVLLNTAETAYIGKHEEESRQLPEAVMERVGQQFPTIHIGLVEKETQPGGTLYEIIASTGSEWLEILADPEGEIWVADRKSIQEVFGGMVEAVHAGDDLRTSLFICAPDGAMMAGSRSEQDLDYIRHLMVRSDGTQIVRKGDDLYGGLILYDGNVVFAVKDMEELEQITLWAVRFFIILIVVFMPLSGCLGFLVSRKAMAGVRQVTDSARRVEAGNFTERVAGGAEGTEIEELVHAFNSMVSRIEILMRELREVTANIAHDLKTPVMRIRGMLESTNWEEVAEQEREQLIASSIEECDRIMPLIESILELSRADAGMLVLQKEPFDLATEIQTAHSMFSALAEDRRIGFHCEVPAAPVHIIGDRYRMQRVIANLIDNALKFTPEGGEVNIQFHSSGSQAEMIVSDTGPGIPRDEQENVFKRFYRLNPRSSSSGHGMGLALVRAFVEAFGGSVSIDSDIGQGCTVKIVVPLRFDQTDAA